MRLAFLEALEKATEIPFFNDWNNLQLPLLNTLPGFMGIAVRFQVTSSEGETVGKEFVISSPYSVGDVLEATDMSKFIVLPSESEEQTVDAPLWNGQLRDRQRIFTLTIPSVSLRGNHGDVILILSPTSWNEIIEWGFFAEHFTEILFTRYALRHFKPISENHTPEQSLEFLHKIQKIFDDNSSIPNIELTNRINQKAWASQDEATLTQILERFQQWADIEHAFVFQKITPELAQAITLSFCSANSDIPTEINDFLEEIINHEHLADSCELLRKNIKSSYDCKIEADDQLSLYTFACQIGGMTYGYFGYCTRRRLNHSTFLYNLRVFISLLSFWLAHHYLLRKEEISARMLQQINMTCNVINANIDVNGILNQLIDNLSINFGQNSGVIVLTSPDSGELKIERTFGKIPENFDLNLVVSEQGIAYECISDGSAFENREGLCTEPIRYIFPLSPMPNITIKEILPQRSLGGVILFESPDNRMLSNDSIGLMTILFNGVSASLKVAFNYEEKLETIRALEGLINRLSDTDALISEMIEIIRRLLKVSRISFLTLDPTSGCLCIQKSYGLPDGIIKGTRIHVGEEISGYVAKVGKSFRIDDIEEKGIFQKRSQEHYFNRSLLSVPLLRIDENGSKQVMGVINVNNKTNGLIFSQQDQQLLEAIAQIVVSSLETINLMKARHEKILLETQIDAAREVQTALLPKSFQDMPEAVEMYAKSLPAKQIGGDFFDAMLLNDGRWLAAVGDVSGKGMPAAILMATMMMILRTAARESCDLISILKRSNEMLTGRIDDHYFVTLQLTALCPLTGELATVSAGHGLAMFIIDGKPMDLPPVGSLPLGITTAYPEVKEVKIRLAKGDMMVVYTDGLTEERSSAGEMFGEDRVREMIAEKSGLGAVQLVEDMFTASKSWREGLEAHDDLTIMAMRFTG